MKNVNLPARVRQTGRQKGFGQTVVGKKSKKKAKVTVKAPERILRSRKGLKDLGNEFKELAKERKAEKLAAKLKKSNK